MAQSANSRYVGGAIAIRFTPDKLNHMRILAIHPGGHYCSAAAFDDYRLVAAVEEERLARIKGSGQGPSWASVDEVLRIVNGELELLASDGITERELEVAKGNLRAEMLLSGEDSGARMSRIGASMLLHGEVLSVDEVLARIDAVDCARVLDAANDLMRAPRTMSAVGPFDEEVFHSHLPAMAAR